MALRGAAVGSILKLELKVQVEYVLYQDIFQQGIHL
jgi:hypothetical protein